MLYLLPETHIDTQMVLRARQNCLRQTLKPKFMAVRSMITATTAAAGAVAVVALTPKYHSFIYDFFECVRDDAMPSQSFYFWKIDAIIHLELFSSFFLVLSFSVCTLCRTVAHNLDAPFYLWQSVSEIRRDNCRLSSAYFRSSDSCRSTSSA